MQIQARQAGLGVAYFIAASLTVALTRYDGGVAFLWFAGAILLADLTSRPRRQWLGSMIPCAIASFLATGLFGLGWAMALPFAAINLVEATVAAWLLRRGAGSLRPLSSLPWLSQFVFAAGLIAPLIAATLAAAVLSIKSLPAVNTFIHYFTGHALGAITLTPLALLLAQGMVQKSLRAAGPRDAAQYAVLFGLVLTISIAVFSQARLTLLFLPILPIILTTFRVGRGGAAVAIVILAMVGGVATLAGGGPIELIATNQGDRIQFFQFYLAVTVLTVLPVAADLQQRERLASALRLSEQSYRMMAEHSTDILLHLEVDGRIRYVSPAIQRLGGHDPARLVGENSTILVAPEHLEEVRLAHRATLAARGETHSYEYLAVTASGERRWFESHSRALLDDRGAADGVLSVVRDISKRKAIEQQLSEAAMTDPLTGLANRRAFRSAVERNTADWDSALTSCIAVLDIDHFKRVNDRFGHAAGDEVLRGFARVAKSTVRDRDLVARIGGEEFAIYFPGTSVEQALTICDRLRSEIGRTTMPVGTSRITVTVSGGVAALDHDGIDAALKLADRALYEAKRNGRDQLALVA